MFTLLLLDWYQITSAMETIGICVVLPIVIVWLFNRRRTNETNKKAEIILKAIDAGIEVNPNLLRNEVPQKSVKEVLLNKLTGAMVTTLMGIVTIVFAVILISKYGYKVDEEMMTVALVGGLLVAIGLALFGTYIAGKKMFAAEIEAETEAQNNKQS